MVLHFPLLSIILHTLHIYFFSKVLVLLNFIATKTVVAEIKVVQKECKTKSSEKK